MQPAIRSILFGFDPQFCRALRSGLVGARFGGIANPRECSSVNHKMTNAAAVHQPEGETQGAIVKKVGLHVIS